MPKKTPRNDLLDQKVQEQLDTFFSQKIEFTGFDTRALLLIEALNDWSNGALAQGGHIHFTVGGEHPCCATEHEAIEIAKLGFQQNVYFPVSGFLLAEDDTLRFSLTLAGYCLHSPVKGSYTDIIQYAESQRIRDVDAAMQLWLLSATEDCIRYLVWQLEEVSLQLDSETEEKLRNIFHGALKKTFSIGQIWNAIWRTARDAAVLSKREYYNNAKAVRTLPKKIDKLLSDVLETGKPFDHYERLEQLPPGALSTLFLRRFGISTLTPGPTVREIFAADRAKRGILEEEEDSSNHAISGNFIFKDKFTELDWVFMRSFQGIELDLDTPDWNQEIPGFGVIGFSIPEAYRFDGRQFVRHLMEAYFKINYPTAEEVEHFRGAAEDIVESNSGFRSIEGEMKELALKDKLDTLGIDPDLLEQLLCVSRYPCEPEGLSRLLALLPFEHGIVAIRQNNSAEEVNFTERSTQLVCGNYNFPIPEYFSYWGHFDLQMVAALLNNDHDMIGAMVAEFIKVTGPITPVNLSRAQQLQQATYLKSIARSLESQAECLLALAAQHDEADLDYAAEFEKKVLSGTDGKENEIEDCSAKG